MNALDLLTQIIGALPTRRDWLDPVLEQAARDLIKNRPPRRAEKREIPAGGRYELEINEDEAWQIVAPVTMGEDWRNVYLDVEDGEPLRLLDRRNVRFLYRGDCVAKGLVISVISPEEQAEANGGNADELRWRLDIDVRAFEIYPPETAGLAVHRLRQGMHGVIEDAFAQQWQLQNDPRSMGYNPLLQTLVSGTPQSVKHLTPLLLNNREHVIAATLVQWLGTPVGNGFLAAVNKTTNNRLVEFIQCQKDPAWVNPFEHTQAPS